MKIIESIFRFVGCFILCYLIGALAQYLFSITLHVDNFFRGVVEGGVSFGLMVYYYQNRRVKVGTK